MRCEAFQECGNFFQLAKHRIIAFDEETPLFGLSKFKISQIECLLGLGLNNQYKFE